MAQQYSTGEVSLVPGQKLCSVCRTKVIQMIQPQSLSSSLTEEDVPGTSWNDGSGDSDSDGWVSTNLSSLLVSLGQSPIDQTKIGRKRYCEDKVRGVDEGIRKKLKLGQSKEVEEYQELLEQLKKKFHECSNKPEKLQVLTVLPQSWTLQRIEEEFGTTYHMARLSKQLVSSKGILTTPNPRPGKTLSTRTVQLVTSFYLSDAISRMMPGKKDCISIRVNGEKEHVQKRLLLSSMREAYQQFQVDHPDVKIGLTKFVELRPKNVVLAGASGTHNVEILTIPEDTEATYKHILAKLSCNPPQPICYLGECSLCNNTDTEVGCEYCVQNDDTEECPYCSKVQRLKKLLMDAFDDMGVEEITYKAWVSVDRSQLETLTKCTEDFVDELLKQLSNLRVHDFIAKQQAAFLEETKANLKPGEAVVLGDFSENYSFVIQDAVQGFHWNNDQATIHPFIAYWRPSVTQEGTHNEAQCSSSCNEAQSDATVVSSIEGSVQCGTSQSHDQDISLRFLSYVVISDCLVHDAVSVHLFVKNFLDFLALNIKGLKKVYYFTDGASSQYKNRKNFINLAFHMEDFNVEAEWHFFATAHGKGPCDGIGGTVKRLATKGSLQRPFTDQIQTPIQLYEWAKGAIKSVHFQFISTTKYEAEDLLLRKRLDSALTIVGTHSFHAYYPIPNETNKLMVKVYSHSPTSEIVRVSTQRDILAMKDISGYVICEYSSRWWLALVIETYDDQEEVKVSFLHPAGPSPSFSFPHRVDELLVSRMQVLMKTSPTTSTGRVYKIAAEDNERATFLLNNL
ncbi:hypothetical protein EMCRGX_G004658 [Ephydatia muelleri]